MNIKQIPANLSLSALINVLNSVFQTIQSQTGVGVQNPAAAALSMGNFKITDLADPLLPQDALNLRYADSRYLLSSTQVAQPSPVVPVAASAAATPSTSGGNTAVLFNLVANLALSAANVSTPSAAGQLLLVWLFQDATGGRKTTWSNPPFRGAPSGLSVKANTWSLVTFASQNDPADAALKWWFQSLVTNQT